MPTHTSVLIAGGGLVGLSAAVFLSRQGIPFVLLERREGLSRHPRARGVNPRTMELLRAVGLEPAVRAAESARALSGNTGIVVVPNLAGPVLARLEQDYHTDGTTDFSALSPTTWCLCHQDELEPLLRSRAEDGADDVGGALRFGSELVSYTQDDDGVTATVQHLASDRTEQIHAKYLIAADGAGSRIRSHLGIGSEDLGQVGHFINIQFTADLRAVLGDRRFIMAYTTKAGARCALLPVNNADRWLLHVLVDGPGTRLPAERCVELVRAAAGVPDLDVRIDGVVPWESAGRVAQEFTAGRVFLAGDAAHVMPPSGAFGSNTGVQDVHNLAWKLAFVLRGVAGPELLATYERERRPVALATVEQAVRRSNDRPRMGGQGGAEVDPEIRSDQEVTFGYRYPTAEGVPDAPFDRELTGRPGTRVPHVPLPDGSSTVDLCDGTGFTLLTAGDPAGWETAADAVAARAHVPLSVRHVPGLPGGTLLVRPDGFVAWRTAQVPADPAGELGRVLGRILDAPVAAAR